MGYECVECWYPITWDDTFGWLHDDREDGQSFDHDAQAELPQMPDVTILGPVTGSMPVDWPIAHNDGVDE